MREKMNRKSLAAGLGAASLLGLGLYLAVPAASADPAPSPSTTASPQPKAKDGRPGAQQRPWKHRARFAARGVHGEATVRGKDEKFHVRTWQRGEITGRSGATLTVRSADGVTWTWNTDGKTRVRKDGAKSAPTALAAGDRVIVMGQREGTTRTIGLVVVPKKK
ncbi:hypothetical protein [Actinomadura rugatobispora]|uniref:DUF5666 domain-containing protein n=1 Tax=Actinomadura rugatobispora TaxID=1994 RepID=A0ABW1ABV9_9ACTN|nr:hypothetical protein GCM10010200_041310 [Actinomadura rugatobispora]